MKVTRIFQKQLLQIGEIFNLDDDGYKHIKATRRKVGDELIIFNGDGHNYYSKILEIDNDIYKPTNVEEERAKRINNIIDILEEYPDLCTSESGDGFLRTVLYPTMRMN